MNSRNENYQIFKINAKMSKNEREKKQKNHLKRKKKIELFAHIIFNYDKCP